MSIESAIEVEDDDDVGGRRRGGGGGGRIGRIWQPIDRSAGKPTLADYLKVAGAAPADSQYHRYRAGKSIGTMAGNPAGDLDDTDKMLVDIVARRSQGIKYNPLLSSEIAARNWLKAKQDYDRLHGTDIYSNWHITTGDLDNDENTPDDILVVNSSGELQYVDGYGLTDGKKRKKDAVFYNYHPSRSDAANFRKALKDRQDRALYNRYVAAMSQVAPKKRTAYANWANRAVALNPKWNPTWYNAEENQNPFRLLQKKVHDIMKNTLHIDPKTVPDYMGIVTEMISGLYNGIKRRSSGNKTAMRESIRNDVTRNVVESAYNEVRGARGTPAVYTMPTGHGAWTQSR
jgi:hypothetical protein